MKKIVFLIIILILVLSSCKIDDKFGFAFEKEQSIDETSMGTNSSIPEPEIYIFDDLSSFVAGNYSQSNGLLDSKALKNVFKDIFIPLYKDDSLVFSADYYPEFNALNVFYKNEKNELVYHFHIYTQSYDDKGNWVDSENNDFKFKLQYEKIDTKTDGILTLKPWGYVGDITYKEQNMGITINEKALTENLSHILKHFYMTKYESIVID